MAGIYTGTGTRQFSDAEKLEMRDALGVGVFVDQAAASAAAAANASSLANTKAAEAASGAAAAANAVAAASTATSKASEAAGSATAATTASGTATSKASEAAGSATAAATAAGTATSKASDAAASAAAAASSAASAAAAVASAAGGSAKLTTTQQAQQTAGATTALLSADKTSLLDPVSGAAINLGAPSTPGGTVDTASVKTAISGDRPGVRTVLEVDSSAQVNQKIADAALGTVTNNFGISPLFTQIASAVVIPLDGNKSMAPMVITAPTTFSIAPGKMAGGSCYMRITADDTNTPQWSGMTAEASSDSWAPIAGTLHLVRVRYDGVVTYYDITQQLAKPLIVPVAGTPLIAPGSPATINLPYSTALLLSSVPLASAYSVTTSGAALAVSAVSASGSSVIISLSRNATPGEVISIAYSAPASNQIKSVSNIPANSFTGAAVSNGLANDEYVTFSGLTSFTLATKTYNGLDVLTSAASAAAGAFTPKAHGSSKMLAASPATDQFYELTLDSTLANAAGIVLALHINNTMATSITSTFSVYGLAISGFWKAQTGGLTAVTANVPYAADQRARFVRTPANDLLMQVSNDNGANWITVFQKFGITEGNLYLRAGTAGPNQAIRGLKCNGPTAV